MTAKAPPNGTPYIAEGLRSLAVPVGSLTADPDNARKHSDRNIAAIRGSLERFGQRKPIVVQSEGMVVRAGNGTLAAARALGWNHLAAVVVSESDAEAMAFALADNRSGELAEWDAEALGKRLDDLPADVLESIGFSPADVAKLSPKAEVVEDDTPAVQKAAVSRPGDLWVLGEHRVLCGDSTKAGDVERVMGGERAGLCFTSPPYAQQRDYTKPIEDWDALMAGVFGNLPMADDGQVLVNLGLIHRDGEWLPYWDGWIEWMREQGWRRFGWYVWDQGPGLPGDWAGRFAPSHEFVFHFNKVARKPCKTKECVWAGEAHHGSGLRAADGTVNGYCHAGRPVQDFKIPDSVIRVSRHKARGIEVSHPAVFSVPLASEMAQAWTNRGDTIYDPFLGSGTTIIAAEQLGRRCRAIEIEPLYVDVAVRRWQNLTGKAAVLDGAGETFAEREGEASRG